MAILHSHRVFLFLACLCPVSGAFSENGGAAGCMGSSRDFEWMNGADVSFIPQIEDLGGIYRDQEGVAGDPLDIFKKYGFNWIRLKLWHTPREPYNDLPRILAMARRIRDREMKFLLNFHYSDDWADPAKQVKPAAWKNLAFAALKDSLYLYTKKVVRALADQGTPPDMVQIGNEITPGMLWNDGRVGGSYDTPQQWKNLGDLVKAGIQGVNEGLDTAGSVPIMIHLDRGGDNRGSRWFFDRLLAQKVDFDIIGLSYYPWWHGSFDDLRSNLEDLAVRYGRDIVVVETAYPWTLQPFDASGNIVGNPGQLLAGYPATAAGQAAFLRNLMQLVRSVPGGRGKGVFYWAPEYISVKPIGSPWENLALFDFSGKATASMNVFSEKPVESTPIRVRLTMNTSTLMDTLRENHFTQMRGEVKGLSFGRLPDGRKASWDTDSELILRNAGGDYWEITFQIFPGDTLFYKFWSGFTRTQATFQRLGWEGPIIPSGGRGNQRIFAAGQKDTVLDVQYYNSTGDAKAQYWRPFGSKNDSIAVYFRVNMAKAAASGRFNQDIHGSVSVRGDAAASNGSLDWNASKVNLRREEYNASFWSGAGYFAKNGNLTGKTLEYRFFIEQCGEDGLEKGAFVRTLKFSESMAAHGGPDTTLHWVYFEEQPSVSGMHSFGAVPQPYFHLEQNYPNPFNPETAIGYTLPKGGHVDLAVYDIRGKPVVTLVQRRQDPGRHVVRWNAQEDLSGSIPSGLYCIVLRTNGGVEARKALFMR
jgi:arabinogalactan endo-1,4-beta-galactosidase